MTKHIPQREWKEDVPYVLDRYDIPVSVGMHIAEIVGYEHVVACPVTRTYIDHRNNMHGKPYSIPTIEYRYKLSGREGTQTTWGEWTTRLDPNVDYPLIDPEARDEESHD